MTENYCIWNEDLKLNACPVIPFDKDFISIILTQLESTQQELQNNKELNGSHDLFSVTDSQETTEQDLNELLNYFSVDLLFKPSEIVHNWKRNKDKIEKLLLSKRSIKSLSTTPRLNGKVPQEGISLFKKISYPYWKYKPYQFKHLNNQNEILQSPKHSCSISDISLFDQVMDNKKIELDAGGHVTKQVDKSMEPKRHEFIKSNEPIKPLVAPQNPIISQADENSLKDSQIMNPGDKVKMSRVMKAKLKRKAAQGTQI